MWSLLVTALAGEPQPRWTGSATLSTSFVAGPVNPGARGRTLDGAYAVPATFNPQLGFALTLGAAWDSRVAGRIGLTWSVVRDLRLADTRGEGFAVGTGGTTSTTVVDTTDPTLWWVDPSVAQRGPVHLALGARYVAPLSRTSLVCNPSWGGIGATVGGRVDLGHEATLTLSNSADRALYRYAAAPRGLCGVGDAVTQTLSGAYDADAGDGFSSAPNVAWTFEQGLALRGWHQVFRHAPRPPSDASLARGISAVTVGVRERLDRADAATSTRLLSGEIEIGAADTPAIVSFPWSISGGYAFDLPATRHQDQLTLTVTLSNQAPGLLYDPGARLRALPATTTATAALGATF
ncbi:MAG TPA: hypothetical protein PKA64_14715 [Myxococcota bacterium]|nr:hypothetical protein [Myxococcota bacterium]